MIRLIFKHTTTIGVRENISRRYTLNRCIEKKDTVYGPVRLKVSEGYGVTRSKWEYEDIIRIADEQGSSIEDVIKDIFRVERGQLVEAEQIKKKKYEKRS